MHDRTRYSRIMLLKALFLIGIIANLMFLTKIQLIPRSLDGNSLSALSYGAVKVDRFIPVTIFDNYHPERIMISQEVMNHLNLDVDELYHLARVDSVQVISQSQEKMLEVPTSETITESAEYPLTEKIKVVFLLASPDKDIVTIGVVKQGNIIIFFPIEDK